MLNRCLNVVDGRVWHPAALENLQPFLGGFGSGYRFDQTFDEDAVFHPFAVGHELRVRGPFGVTKLGAEQTEKAIVAATKENVPIKRLESGVWHDGGWITLAR